MRVRTTLVASVLPVVVAACALNRTNLVDIPFPGVVVNASVPHPKKCTDQRCFATYEVRITNPTQKDANVLECHLDEGQDAVMNQLIIPVGFLAGADVPAGSAQTVRFEIYLPVSRDDVARLPGLTVMCQGIDWHGNPPV